MEKNEKAVVGFASAKNMTEKRFAKNARKIGTAAVAVLLVVFALFLSGCSSIIDQSKTKKAIAAQPIDTDLPIIALPSDNFDEKVDLEKVTDQDIMIKIYQLVHLVYYRPRIYLNEHGLDKYEILDEINAEFTAIEFYPQMEVRTTIKKSVHYPYDQKYEIGDVVNIATYKAAVYYTYYLFEDGYAIPMEGFDNISMPKAEYEDFIHSEGVVLEDTPFGIPLVTEESISKFPQETKNKLFKLLSATYNLHATNDLSLFVITD